MSAPSELLPKPNAAVRGTRIVSQSAAYGSDSPPRAPVATPACHDAGIGVDQRGGESTPLGRVPDVGDGIEPPKGYPGEADSECRVLASGPEDAAQRNIKRPRAGFDTGRSFNIFFGHRNDRCGHAADPPEAPSTWDQEPSPSAMTEMSRMKITCGSKHRSRTWKDVCTGDGQYVE